MFPCLLPCQQLSWSRGAPGEAAPLQKTAWVPGAGRVPPPLPCQQACICLPFLVPAGRDSDGVGPGPGLLGRGLLIPKRTLNQQWTGWLAMRFPAHSACTARCAYGSSHPYPLPDMETASFGRNIKGSVWQEHWIGAGGLLLLRP